MHCCPVLNGFVPAGCVQRKILTNECFEMKAERRIKDTHDPKDNKCTHYAIIFPTWREPEFPLPDRKQEKRCKNKNNNRHLFFAAQASCHRYRCDDSKSRFSIFQIIKDGNKSVSYTHLRAHETDSYLVCRLLLEK